MMASMSPMERSATIRTMLTQLGGICFVCVWGVMRVGRAVRTHDFGKYLHKHAHIHAHIYTHALRTCSRKKSAQVATSRESESTQMSVTVRQIRISRWTTT